MDWNITWIFIGGIAFFIAIFNLVQVFRLKSKLTPTLSLVSIAMGAFTILKELKVINIWIENGEINFLKNISVIYNILNIGLWLLIIINIITLIIYNWKSK